MLLFPYVFGRSGGEAIDELEYLKTSDKLDRVVNTIISLNNNIDEIKQNLIDIIYVNINNEKDNKLQNILLNLKRDLFNNRNINVYLGIIEGYYKSSKLLESITLYLDYINDKNNQLFNGKCIYQDETDKVLQQLYKLCNYPNLRNGFLFASEKLSGIIGKNDFEYFCKQKKKDIFALLKYSTRCITKTTPFSTFNKIFCLKVVNDSFESLEIGEKSFICINNTIFLYLKRLLLYIPEVKEQFSVSINSSLSESNGFYLFFININNNDHLKKIKINPICDYIKVTVYENEKITLDGLTSCVFIQTNEDIQKIRIFLEDLVKEGFLVINFPISIYTINWPVQLANFIKNNTYLNDCKIINQIAIFLEEFEELRLALEGDMDFQKRRLHLINANNTFSELKGKIIEEYPDFPFQYTVKNIAPPDLFYEDYMCKQVSAIQNVNRLVSQIGEIQMLLSLFDEKKEYKELIAQTIKNNFNCATIPLLSFFEIFCKNKKEFESKLTEKLQHIIEEADGTVESIRKAIENKNHSELDIKNIIQNADELKIKEGFGMYFQMLDSSNGPICVLNSESNGWGKNISRFLNFVDNKIITNIISSIIAQHPDCLIADIHDASIHNTNIYPRLTDFLIEISGSEVDARGYKKIPLNELLITINDNDIYLSWKNIKVIPIHFSMENIDRKSSLVKLIDIFSVSTISGLSTIKLIEIYFWEKLVRSELDIIELPRIVYGENIVISRKKWFIKKRIFPNLSNKRIGSEESFNSYIKVIEWKNKNEIPNEIFVKLAKIHAPSKNLHKPLYVNFHISLLIENFLSMVDEADDIIEITEMLPNSDQIKESEDGKKYVGEYIMNIV